MFIETDERILPGSVVFIAVMSQFYDNNDEFGLEEWLSLWDFIQVQPAKALGNTTVSRVPQHSTFCWGVIVYAGI